MAILTTMQKLFSKKTIHQEAKELEVPKNNRKITVGKRLLIAAAIIIIGAFSHLKIFSSLASPINHKDKDMVVSCAYSAFMGRIPDSAGEEYWQARYVKSGYNVKDLAKGLAWSSEGQREAAKTGFSGFIGRSYEACLQRPVTSAEYNSLLKKYQAGLPKEDIFTLIIMGGDKNVSFPSDIKCHGYNKGGSITPLCKAGSSGNVDTVVTTPISGTNIIANKALANNLEAFVAKAKKSGYSLGAYTDPTLANKKLRCANGSNLLKSPGSYRSAADQACLTYLGYPTATGTSMHQWGLAVDFTCNGQPLASSGSCLSWVKNNASNFGLYNKVSGELWHYSTTGH